LTDYKIFQFETMMSFASNISDTATGYPKLLDTDSFVDYLIVNEVAKNVDGYRLSTYLYKDRDSRNPKIFAGPVWDFNLGFGNADYYDGWFTNGWQLEYLTDYQNIPSGEPFLTPNWWKKLFDDTTFRNKVYARWQNVKTEVINTQKIFSYIDSLTVLLDESQTRNFEKWPVLGVWVWPNYYVGQTYAQEIVYLKSWITNRLNWMNANMIGEPTEVGEYLSEIPSEFWLEQNYSNPFNPSTKIKYSVPQSAQVTIKIFDILGNEIETLVNEGRPTGTYEVTWYAGHFPSGVYFYRLQAGSFVQTRKMIVLK
jgi:hypothetical protein